MKLETLLLSLGLLAPLGARAFLSTPVQAQAASQDPYQKAYDEFDARFKQLLAVNDAAGMADLVRKSTDVAVRYADTLCQLLAKGSTEELEKQIAAVRAAWKTAMQTSFVDKIYEYHSLLDAHMRSERQRMVDAYTKALASYSDNLKGDKKGAAFETSAQEFAALAEGFGQVGDLLNVGRCWQFVANCVDEGTRGKDGNPYRACAATGKAVAAYDSIGLAGPEMDSLRSRYEFLKAAGYDKPEPAKAGPGASEGPTVEGPEAGAASTVTDSGPAVAVALTFETVDDPERYVRPNFFADSVYQAWPYLLLKKGVPGKLDTQPDSGVSLEFMGGAQIRLNDTSGAKPEPKTASGNVDILKGTIKDKHGNRPWAVATRIGTTQDTYQGRQIYLAPGDEYMYLFYAGAASMVGMLGEMPIRVLDDNLDGIYGSAPTFNSNWGLAPSNFQPNFDSILVGKATRAIPWSKLVQVGADWYRLEPGGGGSSLRLTPVALQTGTLRLEFKGEAPSWLVVRGAGELADCYFDVCQTAKGVTVPVGDYELFAGLIQQGKKQQMMKCLVLGQPTMAKWTVAAGKETVMQLGAPLHFEFEVTRNGDKGVVKGSTVRVVGSAGENYDRFWNCAPAPSVSARKAGTKKGGKPLEMPRVLGDLNERNDDNTPKYSFGDVWRPLDLEVELARGGDAMELQMSEKKHKLLGGPIESDWK
jgi:hypothetical protein